MAIRPRTIRIPERELDEIDRRAADRRLTRSAYMIGCSVGRDYAPVLLGEEARERLTDIEERLTNHEERLDRIEEATFGTAARVQAWP